jgi:hypothetical protein
MTDSSVSVKISVDVWGLELRLYAVYMSTYTRRQFLRHVDHVGRLAECGRPYSRHVDFYMSPQPPVYVETSNVRVMNRS